jgi:hypothetical protein
MICAGGVNSIEVERLRRFIEHVASTSCPCPCRRHSASSLPLPPQLTSREGGESVVDFSVPHFFEEGAIRFSAGLRVRRGRGLEYPSTGAEHFEGGDKGLVVYHRRCGVAPVEEVEANARTASADSRERPLGSKSCRMYFVRYARETSRQPSPVGQTLTQTKTRNEEEEEDATRSGKRSMEAKQT